MVKKCPQKAFLLAAGFGQRLQPLTSALPKPLIPLWNRPLIDHILQLLQDNEVEEVVVNAHWYSEKLKQHLDKTNFDIKIHLSMEEEIRGTGGALVAWRDFFSDAPFWVINGDIAADVDLSQIVTAFYSMPDLIGSCWLTDSKGPRTVEMDYAGRITCYRSPDPGIEGTYTFCGAQLLSPKIFSYLPKRAFSTLVDAYENAMQDNHFLKGVNIPDSYWNDAGTLQRYRDIHQETKRLGLCGKTGGRLYAPEEDLLPDKRNTFFCVGPDVTLNADVSGRDSLVFGNTVLNEHTSLKNSVIQGGMLAGRVRDAVCIAGESISEEGVLRAAKALEWKLKESAFEFIDRRDSNRSFWRGYNDNQRMIIVIDHGGRSDNVLYGLHTVFLSELGMPIPELLYMTQDCKVVVLEDMGNTSLADKIMRTPDKTEKIYRDVLKMVAEFHREVTEKINSRSKQELEPAFDADLYTWEHSLFEKHMLKQRYGLENLPDDVNKELIAVADELLQGSSVVVHRDLQSSNILCKGRNYALIDYQGMRFGSPAYDLASLLYDPYVCLDPEMRCRLAAEYAKLRPDLKDVIELFFKGAVQRLVQSLGNFGRLSDLGHREFEKYIMNGLQNLLEAADASGLDALGGLVEELIARENMRKY